ncbi:MAG: LysR family transcriptional regulator, partial [Bdellovibrionaceae bacterium]|nr:LysR family transcriptional regulator [Pseudobdellovibrionaceae bacterium]
MQRLNHHHLYVFWVFVKTSSFTKTADTLSIAQSAVTSQVKLLEEALGLNLIDRTNPRRPQVTDAGLRVAEYADSIFESSRELINWATKGSLPKKRSLRIGAISGLSRNFQFKFIEPLIHEVDVKFDITTGDQANLIQMLTEHQLDVVLSSRNADPDHKTQLHSHVLSKSPLLFVMSRSTAPKRILNLHSILQSHSLFIPGRHFEAKPELDAYIEKFKGIRIAGEVDDVALLRILALRSGEVVVMPEMGIRNDIESGDVKVLLKMTSVEQRFYAITRQKKEPNADVRLLISQMKEES